MMNPSTGTLVISLDFELMWGMFDKVTLASYGENLRGVHESIPKTLMLFSEYGIHATWATVGMLLCADEKALRAMLPSVEKQPQYKNRRLSSYQHLAAAPLSEQADCYFAPDLAKQILTTPGQELASHTFSHYYCREEKTNDERETFTADCVALERAAATLDARITAIVFPRNQWSPEALEVCQQRGLYAYRGTEDHFLYRARSDRANTALWRRGLRLLDRYSNISGHHTYALAKSDGIVNIPASRQLTPYSKRLSFLEPLRLQRLKNAMTYAARNREVFHLWWHPHNFGTNQAENFAVLTELLEHYLFLQETFGMDSCTMTELAAKCQNAPSVPTPAANEDPFAPITS